MLVIIGLEVIIVCWTAGCLVCLACSLGSPRLHLTAVHIMDTIGRYQILRKMGWGHFSTVWLAKDTQCVSTFGDFLFLFQTLINLPTPARLWLN